MPHTFPKTLHLFCRVVDNFGDIGVCWRLAQQLTNEYAVSVTLIVDNLDSFQKICPQLDAQLHVQRVHGIVVQHWLDGLEAHLPLAVAEVVIETFGCQLPAAYITAMIACHPQPIWINLEYLSAEPWVDGCHALASPQPSSSLIKYFFFPGFSEKTGGLLREQDLMRQRDDFQADAVLATDFFAGLGVHAARDTCKISLFCYPDAALAPLFDALQTDAHPSLCLVPAGVAPDAVGIFLGKPAVAGASLTQGSLTLQVLPLMSQANYDQLLWACDVNFVRGEDSFVRAQWAGKPFVWHIYPQEDDAHKIKLHAFLDRYTAQMPNDAAHVVCDLWRAWNDEETTAAEFFKQWQLFRSGMPQLKQYGNHWIKQLMQNGDLASNLISFIRKIG